MKTAPRDAEPLENMRSEGLEPPTYKFVACCSIQLSYDRTRTLSERRPRGLRRSESDPCRGAKSLLRHESPGTAVTIARLAEREGFEPSIRCNSYNGLANRRLQPLGHLSTAAWGVLSTAARTLVRCAGKIPQRQRGAGGEGGIRTLDTM